MSNLSVLSPVTLPLVTLHFVQKECQSSPICPAMLINTRWEIHKYFSCKYNTKIRLLNHNRVL